MTRKTLLFRAGLTRLVVALLILTVLPVFYPGIVETRPIIGSYMALAVLEQVLILKEIGGSYRSLVAGLFDVAAITYLVHHLGSTATVFPAVYLLETLMNALVVGLRVGVALSAIASVAYAVVVIAEQKGWLSFAPGTPGLAMPGAGPAVNAVVVVSGLMMAMSIVVGWLVDALRRRETELMEVNARLETLSQRDPLTNLFNRRHLMERMELEIERVKRGHPSSVLMLDLDGFKRINDSQGHWRGDLLLKEIADAISATTRVTDIAGRYGGDEFVILLPDTEGPMASTVGERIAQCVKDVGLKFDAARPVTASVGVAVATGDDVVASLLRRADENAYAAKKQGGDRVVA
jgi:diguanylate cyclase (GGDEF)-like protein